ncbi:MAG: winged helix-turn-helix transcriptional regulator, partial [Elusimicrobia bacterium]|nr:winged helix-turn-helix transcriptional regulator [Elusimicrobiota bacterium]
MRIYYNIVMALSEISRILCAVSEPTRLRILSALSCGKMCVCELCAALGLRQSVISQHLRVLRDCGLVEGRKNGLWVDYELAKSCLNGPFGKLIKTILAQARADEAIKKDRQAAA